MPNILLDTEYVDRLKTELAEAKDRVDLADNLAENYSDKADRYREALQEIIKCSALGYGEAQIKIAKQALKEQT